jgi:mannitol-specific phosphotransferase system IIBC component
LDYLGSLTLLKEKLQRKKIKHIEIENQVIKNLETKNTTIKKQKIIQ